MILYQLILFKKWFCSNLNLETYDQKSLFWEGIFWNEKREPRILFHIPLDKCLIQMSGSDCYGECRYKTWRLIEVGFSVGRPTKEWAKCLQRCWSLVIIFWSIVKTKTKKIHRKKELRDARSGPRWWVGWPGFETQKVYGPSFIWGDWLSRSGKLQGYS